MIKKIFVASIVFALFFQNVFGQIELGVKGGFSLVNLKSKVDTLAGGSSIDFGNNMKPSFHLGGFGVYEISEALNLQGELLYMNKGTKSKEVTASLHYLSIPILVNYLVYEDLSLQVGPEFGFLLAARGKRDGTSFNLDEFYDNSFELTLNLGVKYQLNSEFHMGLRYGLGLSDLSSSDVTFLNRGLHISVGYTVL